VCGRVRVQALKLLVPSDDRRIAFPKLPQFSFRHSELGNATIQTDRKFWKYPHDGLVNVLQSGKMNAYLPGELSLVDRPAPLAGHSSPPIAWDTYWDVSLYRNGTSFAAGTPATAKNPEAAKRLIRWLASPAAYAAIRKSGLEPAQ